MANILASKLYLTSIRKKEILAAIQNPVNAELVSQMKEYLDEEFISPEYLSKSSDDISDEPSTSDDAISKDSNKHSSGYSSGGSFGGSGGGLSGLGENYMDDDIDDSEGSDDDNLDIDDSGDYSNVPDDSQPSDDDTSISESTRISASNELEIPLDSIKGSLNSREDCSGVIRVAEKDNELWIYYNDDINLNNVMTSVIDLLGASGYSYLEFNRLARSNNAVVFDIIRQSVDSFKQGDA